MQGIQPPAPTERQPFQRHKVLGWLGIVWLAAGPLCAQESLDARLGEIREEHQVPALCAVAFTGEKVLAQGVAGVRKLGDPTPASVQDVWHLGSITKSMTSTLAAMFVESGQLSWQDSLESRLGRDFPRLDSSLKKVTLRQLLEHRAGIFRDGPPAAWEKLRRLPGSVSEQRRWWVGEILAENPKHPPGQHDYSNAGYAVAGFVLERTADQPWENLIQERLFRPLKMTSAGFGPVGSRDRIDAPWAHRADRMPVPPGPDADNPPALGPAGTVHCSLPDFVPYGQLHLCEGRGASQLLKTETMKNLHTPSIPDKAGEGYAAGWSVCRRPWAGGLALTHTGTNTMNFAVVWLAPQRNFGFIIATNIGGDSGWKACDAAAGMLAAKFSAAAR